MDVLGSCTGAVLIGKVGSCVPLRDYDSRVCPKGGK